MGIVIGSGIFLTTDIIAKSIPSPALILLAWLVGGLLTLAGALTYAELGAAMPEAGGQYVYLKEAYGPLFGFLFGWIVFLVYVTGGIAALAVAFAIYFSHFFPALSTDIFLFSTEVNVFNFTIHYSLSIGQIVAIVIILLLSVVNYIGVALGKTIQNIITVIKIGIALVAVFWAFDGWNNINFVAGEIKNPQRNLPVALILETVGITVLYVLVNCVYFYSLPIDEVIGVERIAEKSASVLFGGIGGGLVSAAIIISILGSINGSIFSGPRVYYAMAKDKLFFNEWLKYIRNLKHPVWQFLFRRFGHAFLP